MMVLTKTAGEDGHRDKHRPMHGKCGGAAGMLHYRRDSLEHSMHRRQQSEGQMLMVVLAAGHMQHDPARQCRTSLVLSIRC